MRYIENLELREWVKDTLRKTIFQKAHALAIQTGCDILVKLQDATAPTTHQFYATGPLQRAYNNHALRKQPGEKLVSGETGLPLADQAVQSDIPSEGLIGSMVESGEFMDESYGDQSGVSEEGMVQQDSAVPLHLSVVSTGADETHVATSTPTTSISQTSQFETDANGASTDIQIKLEPSDEPGVGAHTEEIETKPLEGGQSEFLSPQQVGSTGGSPMFAQPLGGGGPSGSRMRYPVPISPKPYQCGVCQKAFRSLQVLQKHTQTFHLRPQSKLTPRRGRGRGSHHLNRPTHQTLQTSYSVYSGGTGQQTPTNTQSPLQDIPGTSSHQMAQMAQMASSQLAQPQSTPMAVTPSTSDFSQSPSGPIFHSSAPGPSSSTTPSLQQGQSTGRLQPRDELEIQSKHGMIYNLKKRILLTKGPIASLEALKSGLRLRNMSKEQFAEAACRLQMANFGTVCQMKADTHGRPTFLFVKRPPYEMREILRNHPGLCSPDEYERRYGLSIPGYYIGRATLMKLVELGYLTEDQIAPQSR